LVSKTANKIPLARVIFKDGSAASQDFPLSNGDALLPGKEIEITAGYHNDRDLIFKGIVVKQSVRVKSNGSTYLVAECKDKAYRMSVIRKDRYFTEVTDSEAIETLIQDYDLEPEVQATDVQHRELVQYRATDWDFLVARAELNGRLVLADSGKLTVAPPEFSGDPVAQLTFGTNILSFDATLDATDQHADLRCAAWDPANQAMVESEAQAPAVEEAGNLASEALSGLVSEDARAYRHTANLLAEELQAWADAQRLKNVLSKVRGVAKCTGLAQVKPGQVIELDGVGDRFSGKVFVSGVRHELSDGAWEMDLQFGLWPALFAQENDVSELPAAALLPAVNGLQIGVVTQLQDDPDGEDRILVRMPAVDPEAEGAWARVASLDAGNNRGAFFRPEIGDEVVLGFLNDDPRSPIVLGMLHSSNKPAPVTAADDNHEKGFYTRDGLKLVFDDELKSIRLETPKGNVVQLSEDESGILIEDQNGNKLELSADGMVLESVGELAIKASGDVNLEGANVNVSANASMKATGSSGAELSSSSVTVVKGSLVNIN
jgi:Rhs element Vgr protein